MNESELIRLIKQTVRLEIAQALLGSITSTDDSYTTSIRRFETDSEIEDLRLMRPYGFASRPPADMTTLVSPINGDPSHLMALSDFDEGRPSLEEGESACYGPQGQIVYFDADGNLIIGEFNSETGIINPLYKGKFGEDGSIEFTNEIGTFGVDADGNFAAEAPEVKLGEVPSFGAGLGQNIESRLSALETALATLTSVFGVAHTHPVISIGSPTGPPVPPTTPFVAVALPVASSTVTVAE